MRFSKSGLHNTTDEDEEEEEGKAGRRKRRKESREEDEEKKNRPEPTLTDLIELSKKHAQEMRPEQLHKKLAEKGSLSKQAVWEVRKESRVKFLKSLGELVVVLAEDAFSKQKAAKMRKMVEKRNKYIEGMEYSTYLKMRRRRRMLFNTFLVLFFLYFITKSIIAWGALYKPVKPIEKPVAVDTFNTWDQHSNVMDMPEKRGAPVK